MGAAWETIDNPAMVLIDISEQIAHHCQVLNACPRVKSRSDRCEICFAVGVQPSGFQPSGGFCMNETAAIAIIPYAIPRYAKVGSNPTCCINHPAPGPENNDPAPNPSTAMPGSRPRRSRHPLTTTVIDTI